MSLYHRFHERFGTAGVVLGVIALILALTGTAFAAGGGLNGKQKKEVKAIAKSFQGSGPAGAPGTPGTNGTNGKDGVNGTNGQDGTNGTDGESVTVSSYTGSECHGEGQAGAKFTNATGTAYACNGAAGGGGGGGGGSLPATLGSGETETGTWFITVDASEYGFSPISFPIPLAEEDAETIEPKFWKSTIAPVNGCPGNVGEPKANPGFLCIYGAVTVFPSGGPTVLPPDTTEPEGGVDENEIGTSGALLAYQGAEVGLQRYGSFAITAP